MGLVNAWYVDVSNIVARCSLLKQFLRICGSTMKLSEASQMVNPLCNNSVLTVSNVLTTELLPSTVNWVEIEIVEIWNMCRRHHRNVLRFLSSIYSTILHWQWPCGWLLSFDNWTVQYYASPVSIDSSGCDDSWSAQSTPLSIWFFVSSSATGAVHVGLNYELNLILVWIEHRYGREENLDLTFDDVVQSGYLPIDNRVVQFHSQIDRYSVQAIQFLWIVRPVIRPWELRDKWMNENNELRSRVEMNIYVFVVWTAYNWLASSLWLLSVVSPLRHCSTIVTIVAHSVNGEMYEFCPTLNRLLLENKPLAMLTMNSNYSPTVFASRWVDRHYCHHSSSMWFPDGMWWNCGPAAIDPYHCNMMLMMWLWLEALCLRRQFHWHIRRRFSSARHWYDSTHSHLHYSYCCASFW